MLTGKRFEVNSTHRFTAATVLLLCLTQAAAEDHSGFAPGPLAQSFFPAEDDDRPRLFLPDDGDSDPSNFVPREGDSDPANFLPRKGDSDPANFLPRDGDSNPDNFESPDLDELALLA